MIIQEAQLTFDYNRVYSEQFSASETLIVQSSPPVSTETEQPTLSISSLNTDTVELSERGNKIVEEFMSNQRLDRSTDQLTVQDDQNSPTLDAELSKLVSLVESFTGKSIALSIYNQNLSQPSERANVEGSALEFPSQMASLIYQYKETYTEQEKSVFNVSGSLTFSDGESLTINLAQYTDRTYFNEQSLLLKMGEVELVDPLVVNLDGQTTQLTERSYEFDLTAQGKDTSIHFATGQSGFLAIDSNGNGNIDDGSELFGALSGNGYRELAKYDDDNNGFIDAADSIFNDLLFYQKDEQGQDKLSFLSSLGIGAIYLGSQSTPLNIKDENNQLLGKVRSGSFFIYGDKTLGTTQQVDLVV